MKREGRQHGMVRSYEISRPSYTKIVNMVDSPATAGIFVKVSSKPTNHSKFTGKCSRPRCRDCLTHPTSKSKDKAKGTHKQTSIDLLINDRSKFINHKVEGSATAILGQLAARDDQYWDYYEDEEEDVEYELDDVYNRSDQDILPVLTAGKIEEIDQGPREQEEDDDAGRMSEVGFVLELEDEGWCLVGEM
ncbi:hypothetical protein NE237_005770 [Protea cynaroides]|uniref:Uncharacterized protein n=1 Tax=Protea cynaroides TaxID=273540 RepID=A0A9Q0KLA3_9MAGN|nr:hypothetical protein NE237_005770 [Protea cynaroides]